VLVQQIDPVSASSRAAGVAPRVPERHDGLEFGGYYYAHDCGVPYERNDHWLEFFARMAEQIQKSLRPATVLDAGCALGMLVEALRDLGVEAYGVDISEYAIAEASDSVKKYVRQASLTEPLPDRYDLITCVEVIEHIPSIDAERAIANLCTATDRVLLSSSPFDYSEPTHVNVHPPEEWAALFARHGFVRNLDFDASFVTDWAVLFERKGDWLPDVIRPYERAHWQLQQEVREIRGTALQLQGQLERGYSGSGASSAELNQELLATRDALIGTEAQLGEALGRVRELDAELSRYRIAADRLDEFTRSPVWRYYEPYHDLRSKIGRRVRALLGKIR